MFNLKLSLFFLPLNKLGERHSLISELLHHYTHTKIYVCLRIYGKWTHSFNFARMHREKMKLKLTGYGTVTDTCKKTNRELYN